MPSIEEVTASLRGMGYSEGQARRLAGDPSGEPKRVAGRRFVGTQTRAPAPRKQPRPRKPVGGDPKRFTAGTSWGVQRKAAMIGFVRDGLVAIPDLWTRYGITAEEFTGWCEAFDRKGVKGLRTTVRERAP